MSSGLSSADAHALLDAARDGHPVNAHLIRMALLATGDLDPPRQFRRPWMASQDLPADPPTDWEPKLATTHQCTTSVDAD